MSGVCFEDLSIGQSAELTRIASAEDVAMFAACTGDDNPLHLDEAYAATTAFKSCIAHGMLSAGYISAVLGTRLPGPGAIYVSQSLQFKRPVRVGATVLTRVEVAAMDEAKGRVTFACVCSVDGKAVVEGEAVIIAPRRPAAA